MSLEWHCWSLLYHRVKNFPGKFSLEIVIPHAKLEFALNVIHEISCVCQQQREQVLVALSMSAGLYGESRKSHTVASLDIIWCENHLQPFLAR